MAVSPIGNLTYINQASSATSSIQASNMPHSLPVNTSAFQEQMQKVQEVRPTENAHKISDEKEDSKESKYEQNTTAKKPEQDEEAQEELTEETMLMTPERRILDIKG